MQSSEQSVRVNKDVYVPSLTVVQNGSTNADFSSDLHEVTNCSARSWVFFNKLQVVFIADVVRGRSVEHGSGVAVSI